MLFLLYNLLTCEEKMITLLNKFDDKYIIKEEDVLEIVSFYLRSNNLDNYLKNTIFDDNENFLASFDTKNNIIIINNERVWKFCYKNSDNALEKYHFNEEYYSYFLNFYYISVLFHEMTHAKQKMEYENNLNSDLYNYLYELCRMLEYSDLSFYNKNHDLLPLEIEANNNGYLKAYQLMTYTKLPGKEASLMHLEYLKSLLSNYRRLNNYKVLAPMDKLHVKNPVIDIEKIYNLMDNERLSKMDRLNYGLDITPKEYDSIEKEKQKILLRR